jgi:acid phosphatase
LLIFTLTLAACSPLSDSADGTSTSTVEETSTSASTTTSHIASTSTSEPVPETVVEEPPGALLVVGDWGSGTLPQGAVAGAMERYSDDIEVDAVLTTGDNFYSDDTEFLMHPYRWMENHEIPWWITWGNHDVESTERIEAVNQTFDDPPRWTVHQWGRVDVVIIDSNQISSLGQAGFLLQTMSASHRPTIITLHHPPYSCSHTESTIELVSELATLLDDDVVLVLAGHDHNYQRFESAGVTYIVSGGGGQSLYDLQECPDNHPEMLAGFELHHFVALRQTGTSIEATSLDVNGEPIDAVSITLP